MLAPCGQIPDRSAIREPIDSLSVSQRCSVKITDSKGNPTANERGSRTMKADDLTEIFLWSQSVDRLVRLLQRLESFSIRPRQELKVHEVQLEEIRARLNADFAQAMAVRERSDETRLRLQQTAWKRKNSSGEMPS